MLFIPFFFFFFFFFFFCRISSEIVDLSSPQYVGKHQKRISNDILRPQSASVADDVSGVNQQVFRFALQFFEPQLLSYW